MTSLIKLIIVLRCPASISIAITDRLLSRVQFDDNIDKVRNRMGAYLEMTSQVTEIYRGWEESWVVNADHQMKLSMSNSPAYYRRDTRGKCHNAQRNTGV
ncbi:hypothetical protein F4678DRAFT_447622 [Xylaria arbuscula]|nr:hypothetical protein F4678DRAFT_447622 [Xylaria arbuscula]